MNLQQYIGDDIRLALAEDVGSGDISAMLIDQSQQLKLQLLVREDAMLCGTGWFDEAFRQCANTTELKWSAEDGDQVVADSVLCKISGPARALLTAERTALNFLQTLSGTATTTRSYADKICKPCRVPRRPLVAMPIKFNTRPAAYSILAKLSRIFDARKNTRCSAVVASTIELGFLTLI